jgi:hypothetical protein
MQSVLLLSPCWRNGRPGGPAFRLQAVQVGGDVRCSIRDVRTLEGCDRFDYVGVDRRSLRGEKFVTVEYSIVLELKINGAVAVKCILEQAVVLDTDNDTVDDLLANFASIDSVAVKFSVNNVMLPNGSMALGDRSKRLSALLVRGDRGSCKRKAYTENEGV